MYCSIEGGMAKRIINPYNFEQFCKLLKIKHKTQRKLVSFDPAGWYPSQKMFHDEIEKKILASQPQWFLVLKARQEGISTYSEARIFHNTILWPNTNSVILADKKDRSEYIFGMCQTFYDNLPKIIKPEKKYSSKKELVFDTKDGKGLKSSISVATALDPYVGQSMTIQNLHVSEAASFPYLETVFTTLIPTIPHTPETLVIVESTAKGAATEFHHEWRMAKEGKSIFTPIFFAWFVMPEYSMPLEEGEKFLMTEDEERLHKTYHLVPEQLKWRRFTIEKKYRGNEEQFNQEYPENDEVAFIISGTTVFNKDRLKLAYDNTEAPKLKAEVQTRMKDAYNLAFNISPRSDGRLWIWGEPDKKHTYRVAVDVSWGVGQDFSAIEIFDTSTKEQAAEWQGYVDPIRLAEVAVAIAKWYNDAKLVIELNGPGLGTHVEAKRFYWNFYRHKYLDKFSNKETDKINWETTPTFKRMLISYTEHCVNEGEWKIKSERLAAELLVYMREYTRYGDMGGAAPGFHDDLVMAFMIAIYTAYQDGEIYERPVDIKRKLKIAGAQQYYDYDQEMLDMEEAAMSNSGDEEDTWQNL